MSLRCTGTFLTPVKFANPFGGSDSFVDYTFNLEFGKATPHTYGFGEILKGYKFTINYEYVVPTTSRLYRNTCIKLDQLNSVSTVSQAFNTLTVVSGDKPNGISISDRDVVYFPLNRSNEVQKLNYNSSTGLWG